MIRLLTLTLLFGFSGFLVFAQRSASHPSVADLKGRLPFLQDSARIDYLNKLGEAYAGLPWWFAEPVTKEQKDSAETYGSEALDGAKRLKYSYGMAKALLLKASIAFDKYDDFAQTENDCRQALQYYRMSANQEGLYKVYWRLGQALYSMSKFKESVRYLDSGFALSLAIGDTLYAFSSVIISFNNLIDKGDYAIALEKMKLYQRLISNVPDKKWKDWEFYMLARLYENTGDDGKALHYLEQAKDPNNEDLAIIFARNQQLDSAGKYFSLHVPDTSDNRGLRFYLAFQGEYYFYLNDFRRALPFLMRSLDYNAQRRDINQVMRLLVDISKTHFALQNDDSALAYAQEALSAARETDAKQVVRNASKIAYLVYDHKHALERAYFFFKQYHEVNDSLANNEIQGKLAVAGYEQRIELLNQEEKVREVQLQKAKQQEYFFLSGVLVFLLVALILWRNNIHKQKANELLGQQKLKIEATLRELREAQAQLIQSEKMASLGELTAGIAHEIQNPLNFVNNFSEVNKELFGEFREEKNNPPAQGAILDTIELNNAKILEHGQRADSIVKSMLKHSRETSGHKEPTPLNALTEEYLRLSFQGFRAKDKTFNAAFHTQFDPGIGKIRIIPQDMGRVLLNLFNNAFFAVSEKKKKHPEGFDPTVWVSTQRANGNVEIRVKDNGSGIPEKIREKIFQPFFTTKPAGQGTGLGLSLCYDIVKSHGGEIHVESVEGTGAEFVIIIPVT